MAERRFAMDWSGMRKQMTEGKPKKDYTDSRYFTPSFKEDGTSKTIIRFLPPKDEGLDSIWVEKHHHYFVNAKKTLFSDCPTTVGIECPVCQYNKEHWDDYSKDERDNRKRQVKFISNILVVKDPQHPENNGKVFLYAYGVGIKGKIIAAITPDPDLDYDGIDVWDLYNGANMTLTITKEPKGDGKVANNLDKSQFDQTPSAICGGDDDKIEKVMNARLSLKEAIEPIKKLDVTKLEARLIEVLGVSVASVKNTVSPSKTAEKNVQDDVDEDIELDSLDIDGVAIDDILAND